MKRLSQPKEGLGEGERRAAMRFYNMLREIGTMNALRVLLVLLTIGAVMFAGPVSPDYTQQFAKIIEILGRSQTPQWVWLIVGWFLGIASSVVVGWINGKKDRNK